MSDDICNQRKISMQFNIPPTRLETTSPYNGTITQEQLNMRRKVEILKYNNGSNGKKSKKQAYSQISRGNYNMNRVSCSNDKTIPVPSTSAGIPGPIVYLYEDSTIPLYNYATKTNASAITKDLNTTEWSIYLSVNTTIIESILTEIATLIIRDYISQAALLYNLQLPVCYTVSISNLNVDTKDIILNISDIECTLSGLYNNSVANSSVGSLQNNTMSITLNPTATTGTYDVKASIFIGYMTFSSLYLSTSPGFVYSLQLFCTTTKILDLTTNSITTTMSQSEILSNTSFGIIVNQSSDLYSKIETNCIINSPTESSDIHSYTVNDSNNNTVSDIL